MATRFSVGHAMRRRNGTPSSSMKAAGNMKNRTHLTHHEAIDAASQVGSPRLPISAAPALQGTLVPKKSVQAGDPTNPGSKANRQNIERIGATYRVTVPFTPTIDPAAGPTMANAKMIPSVSGRTNNFGQEASISVQ
jgi:hypothetical protein